MTQSNSATKQHSDLALALERVFRSISFHHSKKFLCNQQEDSFLFEDLNLSRRQLVILMQIGANSNSITSKEIAESSNVSAGAVSQMLDPLLEKGLIIKEESKEDRRISFLKLTNRAEDLIESFRSSYLASLTPMFKNLNNKEVIDLIKLLNKISDL